MKMRILSKRLKHLVESKNPRHQTPSGFNSAEERYRVHLR